MADMSIFAKKMTQEILKNSAFLQKNYGNLLRNVL